jgi:hypothetical protein
LCFPPSDHPIHGKIPFTVNSLYGFVQASIKISLLVWSSAILLQHNMVHFVRSTRPNHCITAGDEFVVPEILQGKFWFSGGPSVGASDISIDEVNVSFPPHQFTVVMQ